MKSLTVTEIWIIWRELSKELAQTLENQDVEENDEMEEENDDKNDKNLTPVPETTPFQIKAGCMY